jgi:hypothetical protein
VAAELPLRGKFRAEATTFFIDKRILELLYPCFRAVFLGRVVRTGLTYVNRVVPVLWHSSL